MVSTPYLYSSPPSAPLAPSAAYAQPYELPTQNQQTGENSWIVVVAASDQSGTVYVDQSVDGQNAYRTDALATAAETTDTGFYAQSAMLKVQLFGPFVRVRYVNGGTPQGLFFITRRYTTT